VREKLQERLWEQLLEKLQERLWEQLLEKLLGKGMRGMHQEKVMMRREMWAWLQAQLLEKLMRVMLWVKVRAKLIQVSREQGRQRQARQAVTALKAQLERPPQ